MGARREGRELALQALYALDMNPMSVAGSLRLFWEEHQASEGIKEFAELLVKGVDEHRAELDQRIKEQSKNWSLGRMAKVDLNILRIAVYELAYLGDIPRNVTINEAIEIAKKFGSEDSPSFVNGILDELAAGLPDKPNSP
ncbi:MAG: transcription antitermination factor NusB [Geobacter sp.]|nr:transcription antitermination factor NusB [Geobacter sp.]